MWSDDDLFLPKLALPSSVKSVASRSQSNTTCFATSTTCAMMARPHCTLVRTVSCSMWRRKRATCLTQSTADSARNCVRFSFLFVIFWPHHTHLINFYLTYKEDPRPTLNCPRRNGMVGNIILSYFLWSYTVFNHGTTLVWGGWLMRPVLSLHRWPPHIDTLSTGYHLLTRTRHLCASGPDQPTQLHCWRWVEHCQPWFSMIYFIIVLFSR